MKFFRKRLARFIFFLCKDQTWAEDKEKLYLNKVFLKILGSEDSMTIHENTEKKINVIWNMTHNTKCSKIILNLKVSLKNKLILIPFYR